MKTEDVTQDWARRVASYFLGFVGIFMALVIICMPFMNDQIKNFWFSTPDIYYLLPIPLIMAGLFGLVWHDIRGNRRGVLPRLCEFSGVLLNMQTSL